MPDRTKHLVERRPRAMLFSDIHGFSGLRDDQLPPFIHVILECSAKVIARARADILFKNTWGDGLFLDVDDAGKAAECALQLQEALAEIGLNPDKRGVSGFNPTRSIRVPPREAAFGCASGRQP